MNAATARTFVPSLVWILSAVVLVGCAQTRQTAEADDSGEDVNIGYGTQKKRDVTGSVSSVSADDATERPVSQVAELLEGRAAGVHVLRAPGGGVRVRIRGASSLQGSSDPLYVIDGVPVSPDPGGTLSFLNPSDISKIEVLKDASATAIYGSRGAHGVVLITTKRGD